MPTMNDARFVLVTRKTRLQELVERFNTWPQAKFYLEHNQVDVQDYLDEHDLYMKRLVEAEHVLKPLGRFQLLERSLLPSYRFNALDIIVVIGQDGLVANTLKYLTGQPVIAINPDPKRWDGQLLPFEISQLKDVIVKTLQDKMACDVITFAEASTNDGQTLMAVNDIFIGPRSHTSARYCLHWEGKKEVQSSSGIIVSTGFGSTGWFQSILAGAMAVAGQSHHPLAGGFNWNLRQLQFTVREPFPSKTTGTELVFGAISDSLPLRLESYMPDNGIIFSDGIEDDFIRFNSGCIATIGVANVQGQLIR